MITDDITIDHTEGWRAFVLIGAKLLISIVSGNGVYCRFGITSTSEGFKLYAGDTMVCDETIYVKDINSLASNTKLTITTG